MMCALSVRKSLLTVLVPVILISLSIGKFPVSCFLAILVYPLISFQEFLLQNQLQVNLKMNKHFAEINNLIPQNSP